MKLSNWFEDNATKSIFSYTLVVIAATWAASYFVIDESKINLYKAQVENEQTVNRTLEAKISVLERDILSLANENAQLKNWLSDDTAAYPSLVAKIEKLEKEMKVKVSVGAATEKNTNYPVDISSKPYLYTESFVKGQSFTDPLTNAIIGVSRVSIDYTADIYLFLPGKGALEKNGVKPGSSWVYGFLGKEYMLTLNSIEWIGNNLKVTVLEI